MPAVVARNPITTATTNPCGSWTRCHVTIMPSAMKIAFDRLKIRLEVMTVAIAVATGKCGSSRKTLTGSPPIDAAGIV